MWHLRIVDQLQHASVKSFVLASTNDLNEGVGAKFRSVTRDLRRAAHYLVWIEFNGPIGRSREADDHQGLAARELRDNEALQEVVSR